MAIKDNRDSYVSALIEFEKKSICSLSKSYSMSKTADDRDEDYDDGTYFLEMKFDDEYNNNASEFYEGDDVYILIAASHDYDCYTTGDTVTKVGSAMIEEYTEDLVFAKQSEQTLAYPPDGPIKLADYEWIGTPPPSDKPGTAKSQNPIFDGMKVILPNTCTGVLRVTYNVSWDRWKVYYGRTGTVAVTAYIPSTEAISYLTIDYLSTTDVGAPEAWELQVLDYCTDQPVEGVMVTFDGESLGTTNSDGIVFIGDLTPDEYSLVMIKDGFVPSATDRLHNDSVIIP